MSSLCCSKLFKPFSRKSFAQHFQTFFRLSKIERRGSGSANSGQIVFRIGTVSVGQLELTFRSKQHPKARRQLADRCLANSRMPTLSNGRHRLTKTLVGRHSSMLKWSWLENVAMDFETHLTIGAQSKLLRI